MVNQSQINYLIVVSFKASFLPLANVNSKQISIHSVGAKDEHSPCADVHAPEKKRYMLLERAREREQIHAVCA